MKAVVQRVRRAEVTVNGSVSGQINNGLLLLVGIHRDDTMDQIRWMTDKILKLRIFNDQDGLMNRSVTDVNGGLLVVSQFTLYGDVSRGTRPGFSDAARPEKAEPLYEQMIRQFREKSNLKVESGQFGEVMDVELVNDGPVTILIEKS